MLSARTTLAAGFPNMVDASRRARNVLQFSLRSLFFVMFGVAILAHASRFGGDATGMTVFALGSTYGALVGRRRLHSSLLYGAIGGAVSMWIGLLLSTLVANDAVYARFVRDQFVGLFVFALAEGALLGAFIGVAVRTLWWVAHRQHTRNREEQRRRGEHA